METVGDDHRALARIVTPMSPHRRDGLGVAPGVTAAAALPTMIRRDGGKIAGCPPWSLPTVSRWLERDGARTVW